MLVCRPRIAVGFAAVLAMCVSAFGQGGGGAFPGGDGEVPRPPLPAEVESIPQEVYGLNSYGRPIELRAIHNESLGPPLREIEEISVLPPGQTIRRYYLTCYFYSCRPWFIHPYIPNRVLTPTEIVSSVQSTNPDFRALAQGLSLQEMLEDHPQLGEPLVCIDSPPLNDGLIDENSTEVVDEDAAEQEAIIAEHNEIRNHPNLRIPPSRIPTPRIWPIWHRPYYGLYCLRVRICIPCINNQFHLNGVRYRFWCRFPYRIHQRVCWRRWWWHRWTNVGGVVAIRPWRPLCVPHFVWTRAGSDWIFHCTSWNLYRRWCLYGLRYYFVQYGDFRTTVNRSELPEIASLARNPDLALTTGWRYYWPRPRVRYWPFRPYCTRWYWFRCSPWITYRHFPPILHLSVAAPRPEWGGGLAEVSPEDVPAGEILDPAFPRDPPVRSDGTTDPPSDPTRQTFDSFFDIFVDLGECRYRAVEEKIGDHDGNGQVNPIADGNPVGSRGPDRLGGNPSDAFDEKDGEDVNPTRPQPDP